MLTELQGSIRQPWGYYIFEYTYHHHFENTILKGGHHPFLKLLFGPTLWEKILRWMELKSP